MKKKMISMFIIGLSVLIMPETVFAHPGRTDSSGCHTCKTNCSKWGLGNGEYHCHSGNTYRNSKGQVFNSNGTMIQNGTTNKPASNETSEPTVPKKSSDCSLKSVKVDGEDISISNEMKYQTLNEKVEILVETNDSKATFSVENKTLQVGDNQIEIKATAEDGTTKIYHLLITREKLSDNANIKVTVEGEKIEFVDGKATINVSSDTEKINYEYQLEDEKAKVEITELKALEDGNNIMAFKVIAQDGTEKIYELTVYKESKTDDIIGGVLGLGVLGGIGVGTYYLVKKRK